MTPAERRDIPEPGCRTFGPPPGALLDRRLQLVHLKGLTKLQAFKIGGFGQEITDAGIADLQKALPNCKIYRH